MYFDRIVKVSGKDHRKCSNCGKFKPLTEFKTRSLTSCCDCTGKEEPKSKRLPPPPIQDTPKSVRKFTIDIPDYNEYMVDIGEYKNINYKSPGLYFFYNENKKLLYMGKATALRSRILHHVYSDNYINKTNTEHIKHNFKYLSYMVIDDLMQRDLLEIILINELKPLFNTQYAYYETNDDLSKYFKESEHESLDCVNRNQTKASK